MGGIEEIELKNRINNALKYADTTKFVEIGDGAIASTSKCLTQFFQGNPALIIADNNTYWLARSLLPQLDRLGSCLRQRSAYALLYQRSI